MNNSISSENDSNKTDDNSNKSELDLDFEEGNKKFFDINEILKEIKELNLFNLNNFYL